MLIWCAILGPAVLTLAWVVLGLLMSPRITEFGVQGGLRGTVTNPISGLGVGAPAHLFNTAFIVSGLVTIAGVFAFFWLVQHRTAVPRVWRHAVALSLSPSGLVVAGLFPLDRSVPLHMIGFLLVAGTPVVTFVSTGRFFRSLPDWRRYGTWMMAGSPITLLLTAWFFFSFQREAIVAGQGVAGVPSRLLALELGAYFVALAVLGWRKLRTSDQAR